MSAHVLLVETDGGATVAIRFPSLVAARKWEDEHEGELLVVGCVPLVILSAISKEAE